MSKQQRNIYDPWPACTCIFVGEGLPMETKGCLIHTDSPYPCDICSESIAKCADYRPRTKPDTEKGKWPLCVCGHIAQEHN